MRFREAEAYEALRKKGQISEAQLAKLAEQQGLIVRSASGRTGPGNQRKPRLAAAAAGLAQHTHDRLNYVFKVAPKEIAECPAPARPATSG